MVPDLLKVEHLSTHFPIRTGLLQRITGRVYALNDVSFTIKQGETLALVGESGCGKSTLGRTVIRLYTPLAGRILFDGKDVSHSKESELFTFRRHVQMIFQDPMSSLNPRRNVGSILEQPLKVHGIPAVERKERVNDLLSKTGLGVWARNRFPHEFSGGQRQRIAIARAIALRPKLVIADEPVSALDVSIRAQILNLMSDLKEEMGMAYLFISHDLGVVKHMADRVAVMYLGRIVEEAPRNKLFDAPTHPYTKALIASNPVFDGGKRRHRTTLTGDVPSPLHLPTGCSFHPRCPVAKDRCKVEAPTLKPLGTHLEDHKVACFEAHR